MRNLSPWRCNAERNSRSRGLSFPRVRAIRRLTALEGADFDGDILSGYTFVDRCEEWTRGGECQIQGSFLLDCRCSICS
jgi:hypothetical protein